MQYRLLGKTGLRVSELCLGTLTYGDQVQEEDAVRIIHAALDAGINLIDTANMYVRGRAEEIIGKAVKDRRESVILATKVGTRMGRDINDAGLSPRHIMQRIEKGLRRLQTDYVDIYYIHHADPDTDWELTLRCLDNLVHQGKVRFIACCNLAAWQLCKALWVSDLHNLSPFVCIQTPYNLLTRDIETELLPFCASENLGVFVYNPLAAGVLTGKHNPAKPPAEGTRFTHEYLGKRYQERFWSPENFEATAKLMQVAKAHERSMPQFALAWTLNNPTVTSTVIGATSVKQLEENLGASGLKLTAEELSGCDEVWRKFRPSRFFYAW